MLHRFLTVFLTFAFCLSALGGEELDSLPLHVRHPRQKVLLVMYDSEYKVAVEVLDSYGIQSVHSRNIDHDLSEYFAIVIGSNGMDWVKRAEDENPEVIDNIERFLKRGGHLFVFGTFNGRHYGSFSRFGIKTGSTHSQSVARPPAI